MYTSTAPRDLAGIKHALELGLVLAALVLAAAAHGGTRPAADSTAAPGIAAMHTRGIATLRLTLYPTGHDLQPEVRRDVLVLAAGCTPSTLDAQTASGAIYARQDIYTAIQVARPIHASNRCSDCENLRDHLILLNAEGLLAALFVSETVESWNEV
jgi:hypothetical protein